MEGNVTALRNTWMIVMFFLCIIVICCCVALTKSRGASTWSLVCMLLSSPFNHFDNLHDLFVQLVIHNGGTFRFKGPWTGKIVTVDPANVEYMLKTKFHNYVKGDYLRSVFAELFGVTAMVMTDGEDWRRQREMLSTLLVSAKFRNDAIPVTQMLVRDRLLPLLRHASDNAISIDLQDVFHRFTFDSTCILGLGKDFRSLSYMLPQNALAAAYDRAIEACAIRLLMPSCCWNLLRYFNVGMERRLREDRKIIDGFISGFVADRKEELRDDKSGRLSDILSMLMKEGQHVYSDVQLRDLVVNIIVAARDTTAATLTWFFWLVAQHPQVEASILTEIKDILRQKAGGVEGVNGDDPFAFTAEDTKEMHYLQAALSESLRMYPAVPMEITEAAEDDVLPDGTIVKKGSIVLSSLYSMARMHSIWGKNCCEFRPERWLRNGKFVNESEFKFAAFHGGPRRCLGRELVYLQMKLVAASIIVRYRVKLVTGHPVLPKFGLLLRMKHGLCVKLHPR